MTMRHFRTDEFACPCCGQYALDSTFAQMIDLARTIAGVPFKINSGYRCSKHNRRVGGSPSSSHLIGVAADIGVTSSTTRFLILKGLIKAGFLRIGIEDDFIHADNDKGKDQQVCWLYTS